MFPPLRVEKQTGWHVPELANGVVTCQQCSHNLFEAFELQIYIELRISDFHPQPEQLPSVEWSDYSHPTLLRPRRARDPHHRVPQGLPDALPWCHNPETYRRAPEIQVFPERCIGCRACAAACEHGAHEFIEAGHAYHRDRCVVCGQCVDECYAKSLVRVGETRSAESVVAEVLSDRSFYASEGGVTISGGEPLLQPEFTRDILAQCRQEGIHTAIETNLAWPWQNVLPLVPLVDLFLVDIKTIDDDAHRAWTGISNRHILENLRRLDAEGKTIVVRTPVVVGVNERPQQIEAIADFLATLSNVQQYDLLPYHPLGTGKYESLGFDEPRPQFRAPTSRELETLAHRAQRPNYVVKVAGVQKKGNGSDLKGPDPANPTSPEVPVPFFEKRQLTPENSVCP